MSSIWSLPESAGCVRPDGDGGVTKCEGPCCQLLAIPGLGKRAGIDCDHHENYSCSIHGSTTQTENCKTFHCSQIEDPLFRVMLLTVAQEQGTPLEIVQPFIDEARTEFDQIWNDIG
jgi:hypothetical protein